MAISKEVIEDILTFDPDILVVEGQKLDLGEVDKDVYAVYGNYPYQRRFVCDPSEPLVAGTIVQPIVALERRGPDGKVETLHKLAYATDVRRLGEDLATKVLDRIIAVKESRKFVK